MTVRKLLRFAIFFGIITLFVGTMSGCGEYTDSLQRILAEDKIVFGVADNLPMSYEAQGEFMGYSVEIGQEMADRLNVEAEFVFVSASDVQTALDEELIDVYINLPSPGQKAAASMLTVECGMSYRQIMVVPVGSNVSRLYDLKGKTLCVIKDSDAARSLDEAEVFKGDLANIIWCDTPSEQFDAIDSGKAQAMLIDEPMYRYIMNGVESDYVVLDELLSKTDLIMAMRIHDHRLEGRIETLMEDMNSDGTLDAIRSEWLG